MGKNGESTNIDTAIVSADPLISYTLEHHGGQCDCVAIIRTSSQNALEGILAHTHQKKNKNTPDADEALKAARKKQRQQYISLAKSDDDIHITRHRLPHTKNRITAKQPVREVASYVKKGLGDTEAPVTILQPDSERTFQTVLEKLPIKPGKISDGALKNLGFIPHDFDTYCGKAKEIYKESIWRKIALILSEGKPVLRSKEQGRSSRIMQIYTPNGEARYVLFINQDTLYHHQTPSRDTQHKVVSTSFRMFESYDELLRSQEYALQHLSERLEEYTEWQDILQNKNALDKEDWSSLLKEAVEYFGKQKSFYAKKVHHYLNREIKKPGQFLFHVQRNLDNARRDMIGKKGEIEQVYQNLVKGREKIIMEEVRKTAQLINR